MNRPMLDLRQTILLFLLLIVFTLSEGADKTIVETSKGTVKGVLIPSKGNANNKMLAFKGIPYAEPPTGELRFKAPTPAKSWSKTKVLSAIDTPYCPQTEPIALKKMMGYSENCLHVNVYTPSNLTSDSSLPVMVWIHGGGFRFGTGQYYLYGPDHFVDQNVIVVTFNYRIGALGFLNLGTNDAPGNAGLKDQSLALKWVHDEISNFGGDPNKVTVFGESAGSASVHFHILSDMSKGLFQQAIGESGVALGEIHFLKTGFIERANQLTSALGCMTSDNVVNVSCLHNAKIEDIIENQSIDLPDEATVPGGIFEFIPILESNTTDTPFLSDVPENLLLNPPNKVPMIMGVNRDEGLLFLKTNADYYTTLPDKMLYFIPKSTRDKIDKYTLNDKIKEMDTFYFDNSTPSIENLQGYIKLLTDKMFAIDTASTAKALAKYSKIYLYHFDFDGKFGLPSSVKTVLNLTGATHADELGYLFVKSNVNTEGYTEDSPEKKMSRKMVKLWTNFAKYGAPIPEATNDTDLEDTKWTPISGNETKYLIINGNLTMSTDNFQEQRVQLWEKLVSTDNDTVTATTPIITTPSLTTVPTTTSTPITTLSPTNSTPIPTTTAAPTTTPAPLTTSQPLTTPAPLTTSDPLTTPPPPLTTSDPLTTPPQNTTKPSSSNSDYFRINIFIFTVTLFIMCNLM